MADTLSWVNEGRIPRMYMKGNHTVDNWGHNPDEWSNEMMRIESSKGEIFESKSSGQERMVGDCGAFKALWRAVVP